MLNHIKGESRLEKHLPTQLCQNYGEKRLFFFQITGRTKKIKCYLITYLHDRQFDSEQEHYLYLS